MYFALLPLLFGVALATNPLATDDQRKLDELSLKLSKSSEFDDLRGKAYEQYYKTLHKYDVNIDETSKKDIDTAIDELVFSSVQKAVNSDPNYPKVYWVDTGPRKNNWFGLDVTGGRYSYDNPDCFYRTVPVSDKHTYKIHGRRHGKGPSDVSFSLIKSFDSQGTVTSLSGDDIKINDDGTYTITVSNKDTKEPNHIKSEWNGVALFIRNNLADWNTQLPDDLRVEVLDEPHAEPYSEKKIMENAKTSLQWSKFFYGFGALDFKTFSVKTNTLKDPGQSQSLGTLTTQAQSFGHYKLDTNETLIITITPGNSKYWIVPVYTLGMISVAPWKNLVSFNSAQSTRNHNGSYTFVLSERDPGVHNWLNTTGRHEGTIMPRWQGLPASSHGAKGITVKTEKVDFNDLHKHLPNETVYVSKSQRKRQVEKRKAGYARLHQE